MNYNKSGLIVLLACIFISILWFVYVVFFSPSMELAQLEIPTVSSKNSIDISKVKTPWVSSDILLTHGNKYFQIHCSSCHGKTGKGDGLLSAGLKPPPRNFITGNWKQGGSSIALYKTVVNGIKDTSMPGFSYLSSVDRWALVHYIRSITKNKIKDNAKKLKEFYKTAK